MTDVRQASSKVEGRDASDPYNRESQTFPVLTAEQTARVAGFGAEETVPDGGALFSRGERSVDFFLVLDGAVEIGDPKPDGSHSVIHVHRARQFTGEIDLFNDREILVDGRAAGPTRVVRVPRADFRRMIAAEPDIGEIVMRAFILRRVGLIQHTQGGVVLVGSPRTADTLRIERFLSRNGYPHRTVDSDLDPDAASFLEGWGVSADDLPVVVLGGGQVLNNPPTPALADALGLLEAVDTDHVFDLIVVGAGPAGLASAVYGASEGLDTAVVEGLAPGGQAGTSSKIENYLGFPTGISGQALAGRAQIQAQKFGARMMISRGAAALHCGRVPYGVELEGGQMLRGRSVVIATGATYRTLGVPGYERFENAGVHYAATAIEANLCADAEVVVVGGGNSAGQAAVFLSGKAAHVHVLVRSEGLAASMSDYLIQRIDASPKITLHSETEIVALAGERFLESVTWRHRRTGAEETRAIAGLFVMIGAVPNTGWLHGCVPLDRGGFVQTGADAEGRALASPYQTIKPGLYAVGDVRAGSVKRVASGVGEGSVVVEAVHGWLASEEAHGGDAEPAPVTDGELLAS